MTTSLERPAFIYDDHCPMCRGYTSIFERLGWADRTAFSTIDATTIAALDMDRARHEIPLHDGRTGSVVYGLDAILPVVGERMRFLAPALRARSTRRVLDRAYWLITYNRRHIVSNPPPPAGALDCAPDLNRASVGTYIGLCAAVTAISTSRTGTSTAAVAAVALAATALAARRHPDRSMAPFTAAGHAATVTTAAALAGAAARAVGASPGAAAGATLIVGARKLGLRRWMLRPA